MLASRYSSYSKTLAKHAATLFADGKYDFILAVTDNTVSASVAFNRYEGITASVCHDAEEARSANEQGVNVVITKSGNIDQIDDIFSAFSKGRGFRLKVKMPAVPKLQVQKPEERQVVEEPVARVRTPLFQKKQQVKQAEPVKRAEPEGPELPKRPGFGGWLKDELGIIDDDSKPKPNKKKGAQ